MTAKNFELGMTGRTSFTRMEITNCEQLVLQDLASQTALGGSSPSYKALQNFCTVQTALGYLPVVDYNASGVSTVGSPGGWDLNGPPSPGSHCAIWAVSDGVVHGTDAPTKFGVVLSKNNSNGGPALDNSWTHALRIGWNRSNQFEAGFYFQLRKQQRRTYLLGNRYYPDALPQLVGGSISKWTALPVANYVSPNAGALGLTFRNRDSGTIIGVAPNSSYADPSDYLNSTMTNEDQTLDVELYPDAGAPVAWSTSPSGQVLMKWFDDNW